MDRRTFLKIVGMGSVSIAAGCTSETEKNFYSLVEAPHDMVTGEARWYASTCRECPAGCGILARNREGRVTKIEGNPLHPINRGRLCMRGHAALQGVYNPDRINTPLLKENGEWKPISFYQAARLLSEKTSRFAETGENKVRLLTEVPGESLLNLMRESLRQWRSTDLHVFEPLAYESLKTANEMVLGYDRLPTYHMQKADFLLSFGADFLETWLSPVEYAKKFKEMHGIRSGKKALFFHVSPYQTLTGANADAWLSCRPGTEVIVALGLLREMRRRGKGQGLPDAILAAMEKVSSPFSKEKVCGESGVDAIRYEKLVAHLLCSQRPLMLGTGSGVQGKNACQTNMASNLLNLILDPQLHLMDFSRTQQVGAASSRSEIQMLFKGLSHDPEGILLLNNVNPVYHLSHETGVRETLAHPSLFVVSFSNFMDDTTILSDLIFPMPHPLETWDEYGGKANLLSVQQPAMGPLTGASGVGDILMDAAFGSAHSMHPPNFKAYFLGTLFATNRVENETEWAGVLQMGGSFAAFEDWESEGTNTMPFQPEVIDPDLWVTQLASASPVPVLEPVMTMVPSIRFFDGRGANKPWLCEIPDPLTRVAWQTPVLMHPETLAQYGLSHGDRVIFQSKWGEMETPAFETHDVRPGVLVIPMGQGHKSYGRYAGGVGLNPIGLLPPEQEPLSGGPLFYVELIHVRKGDGASEFAHTDGSRFQHGRKIALSVTLNELHSRDKHQKGSGHGGYGMWDFPLTLPIPSAYDRKRDIYSPPPNDGYRWAMVVDLDRCIGCAACVAACYAENNIGIVGPEQIINGREMAWLSVHRYLDPMHQERHTFLPMLCQHCDNAPCESVCPVYAPHHNKEGLNNQIYNRCIGTRFCSQNCPYKVRRFNWFDWQWPEPMNLQLNPDVTVRSKGVMEKCSFCVQRIKYAHDTAKNNNRKILDGEIQPACLQACPTGAFTFGNILDETAQVRNLAEDWRSYQVMGYLNTKPAVIYLKKVVQEI